MNAILQPLLNLLRGLFGSSAARAAAPTEKDILPMTTVSHAFVLPDADFRAWYDATASYRAAFDNVIIVRSPAGNNLNRYHTITAVKTPGVWFNDDPVTHIRRAYPVVVTVDVIDAATPAALQAALQTRVTANQRFGTAANQQTRFALDWPTDSLTLGFSRLFDVAVGGGQFHEGVDIIADAGTTVRAGAAGRVITVQNGDTALGYGNYVQIQSTAGDGTFTVTYALLNPVTLAVGQQVAAGEKLGTCATAGGMKLVVQQAGVNTGTRYKLAGAVNPLSLFYVNGMTLYPAQRGGINIRTGRGIAYDKVGLMQDSETARPLELHGNTIRKLTTTEADDEWINLDTSAGVTGFAAAWLLQARSSHSVSNLRFNGVNLDLMHQLGAPDVNRLGQMSFVRMAYNVSMGRGNQDLNAAHNVYAPYLEKLRRAGKQVILVYTHQTYGEGAGYVWPQMDSTRWREFTEKFIVFVGQIAGRYKGVIAAHQVWNEQDAPPNAAASVTMPATDYANLLTRTIQAIRAVDPTTPIITGGHTGGPGNGAAYARQTLAAMPGTIRPDAIALHPYGRGVVIPSDFTIFGHIDESISGYWNVMPGKRLWITEWGVLNQANKPVAEVDAYAQGVIKHLQSRHADKLAALVWYAWADSMHNGYGLVGQNNQPKEPLFSRYVAVK